MHLRRWIALGAGALALLGTACQKSSQERAADERKDVAEARKDVAAERRDLAQEQRESRNDAAQATRGEREDVAEAERAKQKEESEAARAEGSAAMASGTVTGRVTKTSDREVVIGQSDGASLRLHVDPDTRVTHDGKAGSIDQLREGSEVRASYSQKDGERHATSIEVQKE